MKWCWLSQKWSLWRTSPGEIHQHLSLLVSTCINRYLNVQCGRVWGSWRWSIWEHSIHSSLPRCGSGAFWSTLEYSVPTATTKGDCISNPDCWNLVGFQPPHWTQLQNKAQRVALPLLNRDRTTICEVGWWSESTELWQEYTNYPIELPEYLLPLQEVEKISLSTISYQSFLPDKLLPINHPFLESQHSCLLPLHNLKISMLSTTCTQIWQPDTTKLTDFNLSSERHL